MIGNQAGDRKARGVQRRLPPQVRAFLLPSIFNHSLPFYQPWQSTQCVLRGRTERDKGGMFAGLLHAIRGCKPELNPEGNFAKLCMKKNYGLLRE